MYLMRRCLRHLFVISAVLPFDLVEAQTEYSSQAQLITSQRGQLVLHEDNNKYSVCLQQNKVHNQNISCLNQQKHSAPDVHRTYEHSMILEQTKKVAAAADVLARKELNEIGRQLEGEAGEYSSAEYNNWLRQGLFQIVKDALVNTTESLEQFSHTSFFSRDGGEAKENNNTVVGYSHDMSPVLVQPQVRTLPVSHTVNVTNSIFGIGVDMLGLNRLMQTHTESQSSGCHFTLVLNRTLSWLVLSG